MMAVCFLLLFLAMKILAILKHNQCRLSRSHGFQGRSFIKQLSDINSYNFSSFLFEVFRHYFSVPFSYQPSLTIACLIFVKHNIGISFLLVVIIMLCWYFSLSFCLMIFMFETIGRTRIRKQMRILSALFFIWTLISVQWIVSETLAKNRFRPLFFQHSSQPCSQTWRLLMLKSTLLQIYVQKFSFSAIVSFISPKII